MDKHVQIAFGKKKYTELVTTIFTLDESVKECCLPVVVTVTMDKRN